MLGYYKNLSLKFSGDDLKTKGYKMPKPTTKWICDTCQTVHDCELRAIMCELCHRCDDAIARIEERTRCMYDIAGNFSRVSEFTGVMKTFTEKLEDIANQLEKTDPNA